MREHQTKDHVAKEAKEATALVICSKLPALSLSLNLTKEFFSCQL